MRVIAGMLGGRIFQSPKGHRTHPMSEKARGAIFNVLGDIDGLTFLDAYAGSGALSIEAMSRGAKGGVAIDSDKVAWRTIVENFQELGIGKAVEAVRSPISGWSTDHQDLQFDLVFADPPYDDIKLNAVSMLTSHVRTNGIFVLSWPGSHDTPDIAPLQKVAHKPLGDIQLVFYRR